VITLDTITAADLHFDVVRHEYSVFGRRVPGVTEILQAVRVSTDFEELAASSWRRAEAIEAKRELGHALHADAHAFDDDDLVWESVDPRVEPYLRAWQTFRQNSGVRPMTRERRVFHPGLWFAGTLDGIFVTPSGTRVLIDIKTGDPDDSGCQFQTAAYAAAYQVDHPDEPIQARWGVQLMPDRIIPYDIRPYADWRDWQKFQAFVTTYSEQAARRRSRRP
jgi:hypothetical protein